MIQRTISSLQGVTNLMGRGAALIVTNRRWGATLSAAALGFGLFVGVAIGPGAAGTFAGPQQLIALPSLGGDAEPEAELATGNAPGSAESGAPLAVGGESGSLESLPSPAPLASESSEPLPPIEEAPPPESKPPADEAEEEAEPETTALAGTVVHANPAAGSYTLAIKGGELVPVHAAKPPRAGTRLSLEGLQLANGTFAEQGKPTRKGQSMKASFRGVVTHVKADPLAPAYTLSGRGASLFVEVSPDPSGALPPLPTVGAYATASVAIEADTGLVQQTLEIEPGEPTTYLDLAGIYAGLDPETGRLLLSSDDTRAGEEDLALTVPEDIDTTKLKPGDSYLATAEVQPDGSLALTGIASDERKKGAEDAASAQGDLKR